MTVTWLVREAAPATDRVTNDSSDSRVFQARLSRTVTLPARSATRRGREGLFSVALDKGGPIGPEARQLLPEDGDGIVKDDRLMLEAIGYLVAPCGYRVNGSDHVGDEYLIDGTREAVGEPSQHAAESLLR